jgi:hypothetical protein
MTYFTGWTLSQVHALIVNRRCDLLTTMHADVFHKKKKAWWCEI